MPTLKVGGEDPEDESADDAGELDPVRGVPQPVKMIRAKINSN